MNAEALLATIVIFPTTIPALLSNITPDQQQAAEALGIGGIVNVIAIAVGVLGAIFGVLGGFQNFRKGSRESRNSQYTHLKEHAIELKEDLRRARVEADKWTIARRLLLATAEGHQIIREVERLYDEIQNDD